MMTRVVKRFELNSAIVLPYFLSTIDAGKQLSNWLLRDINFSKGKFFTILPHDTELEKVSNFECGGVIKPVQLQSKEFSVEGSVETFKPKHIETMDTEVSQFIYDFVNSGEDGYGVVENYVLESDSPHVNIDNVDMVKHNKEVYYCLHQDNSFEDIYKTIRKSNEIWHSLSALARLNFKPTHSISKEQIKSICNGTQYVLTTAYDGEGYVFWERG